MRYLIAILYTISLVLIPMIMIPTLQWYEKTFCKPDTELIWIYLLLVCISIAMSIITGIRWVEAISNTSIND